MSTKEHVHRTKPAVAAAGRLLHALMDPRGGVGIPQEQAQRPARLAALAHVHTLRGEDVHAFPGLSRPR
jgi:hypothetical protein